MRFPPLRLALIALSCLFLASLLGAGAGFVARQRHLEAFIAAADTAVRRTDPAAFAELLPDLQTRRAGLAGEPQARLAMAEIYAAAARRLPDRRLWLRAALTELDGVELPSGTSPAAGCSLALRRAGLLMDLGRDREARDALNEADRLGATLPEPLRAHLAPELLNSRAYLLASATDPAVRRPDEALRLAHTFIASSDPLADGTRPTGSAPLLDTLAEAWHASGRSDRALAVQRSALALADGEDLAIYLRHYDAYRAAGGETR